MGTLNGFIKLHRKMLYWGWYQDHVVKDVFIHLLLSANFKPVQWQGRELQEGQVIVGLKKLSADLGFSIQQIRTALKKLKSTNEITVCPTNKYSVITIVNWRKYQFDGSCGKTQNDAQTNAQPTDGQHSGNNQTTGNQQQRKNVKNVKNVKKDEKTGEDVPRTAYGEFLNVMLSDSELGELQRRYPYEYEAKIERMSRYLESTGRSYGNHYSTLLIWLDEDAAKAQPVSRASYDINELEKIDTLDFID